jgi:hypothetical protein
MMIGIPEAFRTALLGSRCGSNNQGDIGAAHRGQGNEAREANQSLQPVGPGVFDSFLPD